MPTFQILLSTAAQGTRGDIPMTARSVSLFDEQVAPIRTAWLWCLVDR